MKWSFCLLLLFHSAGLMAGRPWPLEGGEHTLSQHFQPPEGFRPLPVKDGSFAAWLRDLPLRTDNTVYLHNGRKKPRQDVQAAVIDIDVGHRDLQQCADAVMRLRAEYLFSRERHDEIRFDYTSGDPALWAAWRDGERPRVSGNKVRWESRAETNATYANFRRYLTNVFIYAGTASLARQLAKVPDPTRVEPGQVFIQGGFPGHAVIVMDVAENDQGQRVFLLAQSYMPAQSIHVLKQPGSDSPWYPAKAEGDLKTPEWAFDYRDLYQW